LLFDDEYPINSFDDQELYHLTRVEKKKTKTKHHALRKPALDYV